MNYEKLTSALRERDVPEEVIDRLLEPVLEAILGVVGSAHPPAPVRLLELVTVIELPAVDRVVADEVLTRKNGFWLSGEAAELLLPIVGESVAGGKVRINQLIQNSVDGPIKTDLGDCAEISISHFVATLRLGHKVVGAWVIAYLTELPRWTVFAIWYGGKWNLDVYPVTLPHEWYAGDRVISGDSGT